MGSVKTNIGHTEGAAGACSVAKGALMMYQRRIPGSLHLKKLHPGIPLDQYGISIPQSSIDWPFPRQGIPRRMSMNSFGIGGSNTHVILEEFVRDNRLPMGHLVEGPHLQLPLSAHNRKALRQWAQMWIEFLHDNEARFTANMSELKNVLHYAIHGRSHLEYRLCVFGDSGHDLACHLMEVVTKLSGGSEIDVYITVCLECLERFASVQIAP